MPLAITSATLTTTPVSVASLIGGTELLHTLILQSEPTNTIRVCVGASAAMTTSACYKLNAAAELVFRAPGVGSGIRPAEVFLMAESTTTRVNIVAK
jgi:hypothetical protein